MKRMLGSVVVFVLALSGCTAQKPDQEIPVFTPTPRGGPSSSPTLVDSPASQAQRIYAVFIDELTRVFRAGGSADLTPVLAETTAGDLQETVLTLIRDTKDRRIRLEGEAREVVADVIVDSDKRVRIVVCEDTSQTRWVDDLGAVVRLAETDFFQTENTVEVIDGRWRLTATSTTQLKGFSESPVCANAE